MKYREIIKQNSVQGKNQNLDQKCIIKPTKFKDFNNELDKAGRLIDFIELGDLMIRDALNRKESCGGHFREESQTETGEAKRIDAEYAYVSTWEYKADSDPKLHKEKLEFENITVAERSYK